MTTVDPLLAFLMTISRLELSSFISLFSALVRFCLNGAMIFVLAKFISLTEIMDSTMFGVFGGMNSDLGLIYIYIYVFVESSAYISVYIHNNF